MFRGQGTLPISSPPPTGRCAGRQQLRSFAPMMIDQLERRTLLTANLQADGTLDITSTFLADNYTITMDASNITVVILAEGFNAQYPRTGANRVQRINLHEV